MVRPEFVDGPEPRPSARRRRRRCWDGMGRRGAGARNPTRGRDRRRETAREPTGNENSCASQVSPSSVATDRVARIWIDTVCDDRERFPPVRKPLRRLPLASEAPRQDRSAPEGRSALAPATGSPALGPGPMQNEILINASRGETRVAILEKGSLAELLVERRGESSMVGSVVKGRVTRVLPGMQASFVDIGLEKAAFLYAGDYYEHNDVDLGDDEGESRPRRTAARPPERPQPRRPEDRHDPVRRAGDHRAGRQGADRHQGRAHHVARGDRRAPPGARRRRDRASASRGASTRTANAADCARSSSDCARATSASSSAPPATAPAKPISKPT